jgi:hypothetical protein
MSSLPGTPYLHLLSIALPPMFSKLVFSASDLSNVIIYLAFSLCLLEDSNTSLRLLVQPLLDYNIPYTGS